MSIITTPDDADEAVADLYGPEIAELGYVPSHTRAMAVNPEAFRAFQQLVRTIVAQLGVRRYDSPLSPRPTRSGRSRAGTRTRASRWTCSTRSSWRGSSATTTMPA